jgi:hypothetical protein
LRKEEVRKEVINVADPNQNLALKGENDRLSSATAVLSTLRTYGTKLILKLSSEPAPGSLPVTTGSGDPRVAGMVSWMTSRTASIRDLIQETGRALRVSKGRRTAATRRLDRGAERVRKAVIGIRDQFFSTYGEEVALDLGFSRSTPEIGVSLLEHITYLYERVLHPVGELPEPTAGRFAIDLGGVPVLLKPLMDELQLLVDESEDQRRQTQDATVQKNDAIAVYDRDFGGLASSIQGMFRMAGMPLQARFVRPVRRRGVTVVLGDESPEAVPETETEPEAETEPETPEPALLSAGEDSADAEASTPAAEAESVETE